MKDNLTTIDRISMLLDQKRIGKGELARALNLNRNTVNSWFGRTRQHTSIRNENLVAVANYFNVSKEWLLTGETTESDINIVKVPDTKASAFIQIPTCEISITNNENVELYNYDEPYNGAFNEEFFKYVRAEPSRCHFLKCYSADMQPYIMQGDLVMIDDNQLSMSTIYSGRLYAIVFKSGEVLFRFVFKRPLESNLILKTNDNDPAEIKCTLSDVLAIYRVLKIERMVV